jgi:hypothetical protein
MRWRQDSRDKWLEIRLRAEDSASQLETIAKHI